MTDDVRTIDRAVDRAVGCMVGAAVGDALGAPFEFLPGGAYRARFPAPMLDVPGDDTEMVGGGAFGWAPGEFTDDTQMALVIAESLLANGRCDLDDVWQRWRVWARSSQDVGATTATALRAEDHRDARERHANLAWTAGNGALMRAFPLALATLQVDDGHARSVVLEQSATTHPHPAAGWGAWFAVAAMRSAILSGGDASVAKEAALDRVDREIAVMGDREPEHASRFVTMLDVNWRPDDADVGNGSVWGCLAQAVWALRRSDDYESAVVEVVDLGRDADTVACVTGALAGAVHGSGAVPARWRRVVHGRLTTPTGEATYDLAALERIARALSGMTLSA
jgi:ADP-ribosyl-[dinitrogen reductase] hydrolase